MKAKSSQRRKKSATRKQTGKVNMSATGLTSQDITHKCGDNADYQLSDMKIRE